MESNEKSEISSRQWLQPTAPAEPPPNTRRPTPHVQPPDQDVEAAPRQHAAGTGAVAAQRLSQREVKKEDVPTSSLQSRDDGEMTEKAEIASLKEAIAAQAQFLEELAEKVRQLQANQANKEDVEPLVSSHEQSRLEKMMKKAWELLGQSMWKLEEESQDPEVDEARRYITRGHAYGALGNYKGMKQLLEKALEIFGKRDGDHPEIALTLIWLSRAYQSLGEHATAKVTLSKAIKILSFWSRAVLPLRFTMKEGPSVLRYIEEATFLGRFKAGANKIYASYPGKFKDGWHILVKDDGEYSEDSVACVYCCTREKGLGVHVPDPFDSTAPCYCRRIYGKGNHTNRNFEQFGYLYQVGPPYDEERMRKAQETADAMNAVLVRKDAKPEVFRERVAEATKRWEDSGEDPVPAWGCKWYDVWYKLMEMGVDAGQVPVVVYYPGMKGMGKVRMDDLKDPEKPLWDSDSSNRGLGGSQKAEVATLEHMGWPYREMDVTEFLHRSLPLGEKVVAWNGGKGQWTRGVIQDKKELAPQGDQDSRFRWTVQEQDEEPFETDRIRFDHGEMDGLDEKLRKENFVGALNDCLPTGQRVIGNSPRQEWLWNGTPAMTFEIRSQDVAALQRLCSDVLCGDFEVAINRAAFNDETDNDVVQDAKVDYWQLQVDKAEFVRAYKYMLMSSTRLTRHQEEQLAKLDGSDSIHLKAAAGAGKTFVAAHKVFKTLIEHEEGQVLFVAPCKSLCLHFVRWLLMMAPGLGAEDVVSSRLKLMYKPYRNLMEVSISDTRLQLEEISSTEQGFVLAVVDESHDIFCPGVEQGLLREMLCKSKQRILLSDVSQSSALEQNFRDLEDYGRYHVVYLTEIVRSTERVVLGAKPFQLSPENEQATSIGANGPPLKSFLFDREGAASSPPFQDYCRYTISSLRHIVSAFPGLNLHHNVAILVPDPDFLSTFQTSLQKELEEEATCRKLCKSLDLINFEDSLSDLTYLLSSDPVEHSKEEIIIDSIQNAKGLEQLIIIAVGMDAEINSKGDAHDLATRARLYQSITRAQLTAIVVNELLPHGWLAHLATCKLKEGQFQKLQAHAESDTAVATKLVQEIQAKGLEENPSHQEDPPLETIATELPSPPEEPTVSAPSRSPNKPSAPETEQKKTVIEMRSSSVWDTSQNSTRSPIYDLKFDPIFPSAFQILKSQLRQVPPPATCPWPPEDVLLCWQNEPDAKYDDGELNRVKQLFLFHRNGAFLRRLEIWLFAASAADDPELSARAVRDARRFIYEGRYAVAPAERRVTVTWDRSAVARSTGAAAAPGEVRFDPWSALGGGGESVLDLEELSERSKRPGAKPMAWPDHRLSEETLKDLEERRKEDGPWNPENLWFFTADLG